MIVVRLSKIPSNCNHEVYFNNYYNSLSLMIYLKSRGIILLGTVCRNQLQNVTFPSEKELMKSEKFEKITD